MVSRPQLDALQLQFQGLAIYLERVQALSGRGESISGIPFRIAAERGDIERRIVEQVFELCSEFSTLLSPPGMRRRSR